MRYYTLAIILYATGYFLILNEFLPGDAQGIRGPSRGFGLYLLYKLGLGLHETLGSWFPTWLLKINLALPKSFHLCSPHSCFLRNMVSEGNHLWSLLPQKVYPTVMTEIPPKLHALVLALPCRGVRRHSCFHMHVLPACPHCCLLGFAEKMQVFL